MFSSLYSKLAAVLTALFCLVGLSFIGVTLFSTNMYQLEVTQRLNSRLAEHIVEQRLLTRDKGLNEEAMKEIFNMLMVINPSIEIYLLDPEGRILAYSAPPGRVKRTRVDLGPIEKWLEGDAALPIFGDDPREPGTRKIFSAARVPGAGKPLGYLYVILGGESYDTVVEQLKGSYILRVSSWMISASLLFALIAGLVLFASLTGRLKRLAKAMDAFRGGAPLAEIDFPAKRGRRSADEIERLGSAFREMAGRIQEQIEALRKSDSMRRELVANVSHDLRTPLATLQGYIETLLLKEGSLSGKERREYLETAVRHCERLGKLVGELFELARLDSYEIRVDREPFNLNELVQDVVQKFQLRAGEKEIALSADLVEGLPFVHADIGLIERVLENLIENAIRHTPKGGSVRLGLAPLGGDVEVRISDTGRGIPPEALAHIFDRFYRLAGGREEEPAHSGLGLAIAKRILELHGRTIGVESAPNAGAAFTFRLPAYEGL